MEGSFSGDGYYPCAETHPGCFCAVFRGLSQPVVFNLFFLVTLTIGVINPDFTGEKLLKVYLFQVLELGRCWDFDFYVSVGQFSIIPYKCR